MGLVVCCRSELAGMEAGEGREHDCMDAGGTATQDKYRDVLY